MLASYGHVRDLPARGAAVRPDEGFALRWALLPGAAERLAALAAAARRAARLVLATDPDREGEAIAWHVTQELQARAALCAALELHTVGRLLCMPNESWRPAAACGRPVPRALGASSTVLSRPGLAALTSARACGRDNYRKSSAVLSRPGQVALTSARACSRRTATARWRAWTWRASRSRR